MTGLYPSKTGVLGNMGSAGGNPLSMPTIATMLQKAGYWTAYFGKWHLGKDPVGTAGWNQDFGVTGPETEDDAAVTSHALEFLANARDSEQPFALFLSYLNPHDIYQFRREHFPTPTQPMTLPPTWHHKDLSTVPWVQSQFMFEDHGKVLTNAGIQAWERYRELYREKVHLYDLELGQVLHALQNAGLWSTTLVVVTSDHGDMDTQHGLVFKGPFMYEHMVRIPLLIKIPEAQIHAQIESTLDFPTINVDLAPTLADFAGFTLPQTDGLSLKPLLTGKGASPQRDAVIGQYYSKQNWVNPIRMIRTSQYKYNIYRGHGAELYHLASDPLELQNVVDDAAACRSQKTLSHYTATLDPRSS